MVSCGGGRRDRIPGPARCQRVGASLDDGPIPTGIVVVNLTGCAVIGLLAGLLAAGRIGLSPHWREFVFVGLLGGFTTFSTFGLDTFLLVKTNAPAAAALNVALQLGGGLVAVWIGYQLGLARGYPS